MELSGQRPGKVSIEELFEQGADSFGRWFARMMNANGWSHQRLVQLAAAVTDGKPWVHSSQIASLRAGKLKSPGPRSFAAMVHLFNEIDKYQKGKQDEYSPDLSAFDKQIENATFLYSQLTKNMKQCCAKLGIIFMP